MMNIAEVKKLSAKERLEVMEVIWESLLNEPEELETPKWHKQILQERERRIERGEVRFIPLAELKKNHP
jgi:putative addiction module component (TIGR02574 family)